MMRHGWWQEVQKPCPECGAPFSVAALHDAPARCPTCLKDYWVRRTCEPARPDAPEDWRLVEMEHQPEELLKIRARHELAQVELLAGEKVSTAHTDRGWLLEEIDRLKFFVHRQGESLDKQQGEKVALLELLDDVRDLIRETREVAREEHCSERIDALLARMMRATVGAKE